MSGTPRLILASSSPYRKALLQRLGLEFEVIAPHIDESPQAREDAKTLVERLAVAKARAVADKTPGALVIGSDQVALHAHRILGKPLTHENAVEQLRTLSGASMTLYTGLALIHSDSGRLQSDVVLFQVQFRRLTASQIEQYLRRERPYDCAGSVKAESLGIALLERLEGQDPSALIGLPLIRLVTMLQNEGVSVI